MICTHFTVDLNCYNCTFNDLYHDHPMCAINKSLPNGITICTIGGVKMEVDLVSKFNLQPTLFLSHAHILHRRWNYSS